MSKELFEQFRKNLAVKNANEISKSYRQITEKLNGKYYDSDSDTLHCRQVGSYGRHTAVQGVSDLDMAFVLPWSVYDRFQRYENNKQSSLLGEIRLALKERFPNHTVRAQQQVVSVDFSDYVVKDNWRLPVPLLELINATHELPSSNLKRELILMRLAAVELSTDIGDPEQQRLRRLLGLPEVPASMNKATSDTP